MSIQIKQIGTSVTQLGVVIIGDGTSTTVRFDLTKWPVGSPQGGDTGFKFNGVLPSNVVGEFESGPGTYNPTVSMLLDGSLLTITLSPAPPAPAGPSRADLEAVAVNLLAQLLYNGV